jgi:hypothetical protein
MSPNGKESEMAPARASYGLTLARQGLIVRPVGAMQRRDYGKRGNPLVSRLE